MSADFAINPNAKVQYTRLGYEGEILLIIDDFLLDPDAAVDLAADGVTYGPAGAAYPGLRAPLPEAYNFNVYNSLTGLINEHFGIPPERKMRFNTSFAMITEQPVNLKPKQRVPHIDQCDPFSLAMVHYLCPAHFGGTAFFRHRATQFEVLTPDRVAQHNETLAREINTRPMPAGFPDKDHPFYEQIGAVPARFNRFVCYRACILHSPDIARDAEFSPNPREGRLTVTAFLNPTDLIPLG